MKKTVIMGINQTIEKLTNTNLEVIGIKKTLSNWPQSPHCP